MIEDINKNDVQIPKEVMFAISSTKYTQHAIEYYLLSRYAYFHKMLYSFIINSFWTVEYLMLSILCLKYENLDVLSEDNIKPHKITEYWKKSKNISHEKSSFMDKFDNYIGKVQGYFEEWYNKNQGKSKLIYTGKKGQAPKVKNGEGVRERFDKTYPVHIDELNHFFNFMLHDVLPFKSGNSSNLMSILAKQGNLDLYKQENKYSIISPNKKYHGETNKRNVS